LTFFADFFIIFSAASGNPLIREIATFRYYFVIALVVVSKINSN
jgi:hypothetical protein